MHPMEHSAYLALRENATVLEADGSGDKVLLLEDGTILKLFRRKRLISSALLFPYAQRFADNIDALKKRAVPCPEVIATYRIASISRDAVRYTPLPGLTIRQVLKEHGESAPLRAELGTFIAHLHDRGVYFRSLHLGNVILTPESKLGLIDISDMKCQRRGLSDSKRLRNFQHLLRYKEDRAWLVESDTGVAFISAYTKGRSVHFTARLTALFA
ncbi:lipopolysaccharide kinase InaA family protein [Pseudomonas petrae]|uniref:Lipopolysaccharide kinase InaA family protein n=1 Tax=Pseudomonas petrae TaxID=2912190 RepID=A0ABS9I8I3_9PSED|nr:lipopolysaccharide kinase InaA family protein [Pseudomonas petrae]MCF7534517.1 lipopolysaccharide kinase InaA family protein [Pseudomonas petrae]MCF7539983.1 lipopolysaccharide kinase InaA family protein [Pseudomonas petrae]MCF7544033.1 lipopolysaccharide kinase InaA family protein [Pseudomonas petrae]MCF7558199.1 lipopolysaccharide kinase InaA family protein [Pseudomonas petrae]